MFLLVCSCAGDRTARDARAPGFLTFAEALTTETGELARVAFRLFSASDMREICGERQQVVRLSAWPEALRVRTGEPIALREVQVRALDHSGASVGGVPLTWTMRLEHAPMIDIRETADGATLLLPRRRGSALLAVRTLCPQDGAVATIIVIHAR